MKAKTRHFPITDFGGRGGLNVPFNLSKIVDDLENRSRRNNLCFEGIPESPNETWQESESKIKHLISSHMPEVGTDFVIERASSSCWYTSL